MMESHTAVSEIYYWHRQSCHWGYPQSFRWGCATPNWKPVLTKIFYFPHAVPDLNLESIHLLDFIYDRSQPEVVKIWRAANTPMLVRKKQSVLNKMPSAKPECKTHSISDHNHSKIIPSRATCIYMYSQCKEVSSVPSQVLQIQEMPVASQFFDP